MSVSDIKTDQPLVVRFHIQDKEKSKEFIDQIFNAMIHHKELHGTYVTAIDREDIFQQMEDIEQAELDNI